MNEPVASETLAHRNDGSTSWLLAAFLNGRFGKVIYVSPSPQNLGHLGRRRSLLNRHLCAPVAFTHSEHDSAFHTVAIASFRFFWTDWPRRLAIGVSRSDRFDTVSLLLVNCHPASRRRSRRPPLGASRAPIVLAHRARDFRLNPSPNAGRFLSRVFTGFESLLIIFVLSACDGVFLDPVDMTWAGNVYSG